jgi:hypothetical protein
MPARSLEVRTWLAACLRYLDIHGRSRHIQIEQGLDGLPDADLRPTPGSLERLRGRLGQRGKINVG